MQDTFYDVVDELEEQNIETLLQSLIKQNYAELTEQCRIYERALLDEDARGIENGHIDDNLARLRFVRTRGDGLLLVVRNHSY
jgi:hypothetical protein